MSTIDRKEPKNLLDSVRRNIVPQVAVPQLMVQLCNATHLRPSDYMGTTDSYVTGRLTRDGSPISSFHSPWVSNSNDPKYDWSCKLCSPLDPQIDDTWALQLQVYDYKLDTNELLGEVNVPLGLLMAKPGSWSN